jgi:DinB superfamily
VDHCDECGFVYAEHGTESVADEIEGLGGQYGPWLSVPPDDAGRHELLRRRPGPDVWSALEYACHVRDVLIAQRERLFLAQVEDRPTFSSIYRDQRVILGDYVNEDPLDVAEGIRLAAHLMARALGYLDAAGWSRTCIYGYPAPTERTLLWLAQHTLHEGLHHLADIEQVVRSGQGRTQRY